MMKVKIKVSIASADWSYAPGQEVDIDEKLAVAWFQSGIAEPVEERATRKVSTEKATAKRKAVK